jgi:hypothetical protein
MTRWQALRSGRPLRTAIWLTAGLLLVAGSLYPLASQRAAGETSAGALGPGLAAADTVARYRPAYRTQPGQEIVMVFIGASFCGADQRPGFPALMETAKVTLQRAAAAQGKGFSAHAVLLDWETDRGLAFLRPFGAWDEISVGRNWVGEGAQRFIWGSLPGPATVPQVVIIERTLDDGDPVRIHGERQVKRIGGADQIAAWIQAGAHP